VGKAIGRVFSAEVYARRPLSASLRIVAPRAPTCRRWTTRFQRRCLHRADRAASRNRRNARSARGSTSAQGRRPGENLQPAPVTATRRARGVRSFSMRSFNGALGACTVTHQERFDVRR